MLKQKQSVVGGKKAKKSGGLHHSLYLASTQPQAVLHSAPASKSPALLPAVVSVPAPPPATGQQYQQTIDGQTFTVRQLSTSPFICLLDNFLTHDECDALIACAQNDMQRTVYVDPGSGERRAFSDTTTESCYLGGKLLEATIVQTLEARVAKLTDIPVVQGESFQVIHYHTGDFIRPHHDYFDPAVEGHQNTINQYGQRLSTLVFYLNTVNDGGETYFPDLGLKVMPRKGSVLWFNNLTSTGDLDKLTLHGGAPVTSGEKWLANKWLTNRHKR
jgi:prolyl 4-hydroxylase